ncbi:MAG: hypothetical protein IH881_17800 [Myxococcales bacterium]|nr:hypothetical protein [Myxococcales bacterium]
MKTRTAARWALIVVVLFPQAALAKPLAREVLAETPLNHEQIQAVLDGKLVTSDVIEISKRELGAAAACLIPLGRDSSLEFARNSRVTMPDKYKDTSGPIDPRDIEGSLAALNLGGNVREARRYLEAEPGFDINLSNEEIAAFRALAPAKGEELAIVEAKLREVFAQRIRSYRARGLDGVAPFARGNREAKGESPASDLRRATDAAGAFRKFMPKYYQALLNYPKGDVPNGREFLFWSRTQILGRPVLMLHQRLSAVSEHSEIVVERQFYASHFLNIGQVVIGLLPVQEGTLAFYVNRSWVNRWHGFGIGTKRAIGAKIARRVTEDLAKDANLCEGIPRMNPSGEEVR